MLNIITLLALLDGGNKQMVCNELVRYGTITGDQRIACQGTNTRLTTYSHLGYRWTVCKVNGNVERIDKRAVN